MARSTWRQLSARLWQVIATSECVVAHVGVYLVAGTTLVLVNAIRSPGELWFWRPMLVWSALLAAHALTPLIKEHFGRMRAAAAVIYPLWTRIGIVSAGWSLPSLSSLTAGKQRPGWDSRQSPAAPEGASSPWPAPSEPPAPVSPAHTWPTQGPTWTTSWPSPPAPAPPTHLPVRPTGYDTVLNGAQMAHPEQPRWDELEVAAAMWLAQRSPDAEHITQDSSG